MERILRLTVRIRKALRNLTLYHSTGVKVSLALGFQENRDDRDSHRKLPLIGGVLAAIVASICCIGPLVLVTVGISGAWISNLAAFEPYRLLALGVAIAFMVLAYRKIYRAPAPDACEPGTLCAMPETNRAYKIMFWVVSALVLLAMVFPYFAPLFY